MCLLELPSVTPIIGAISAYVTAAYVATFNERIGPKSPSLDSEHLLEVSLQVLYNCLDLNLMLVYAVIFS